MEKNNGQGLAQKDAVNNNGTQKNTGCHRIWRKGGRIATEMTRTLQLHLRDILLLKVSNIFHYWAVVPLCEFGYIQKPFYTFPKKHLLQLFQLK